MKLVNTVLSACLFFGLVLGEAIAQEKNYYDFPVYHGVPFLSPSVVFYGDSPDAVCNLLFEDEASRQALEGTILRDLRVVKAPPAAPTLWYCYWEFTNRFGQVGEQGNNAYALCADPRKQKAEDRPSHVVINGQNVAGPLIDFSGNGDCYCQAPYTFNEAVQWCDGLTKDTGCTGEKGAGNPCNVATGNKYQSETDFSNSGLSFVRSYNSQGLADVGLGLGWRSNYQKSLSVSPTMLIQVSGAGRGEPWRKLGGIWTGDSDSDNLVIENATGFQLTKANGAIENYDLTGRIVSETDTNGHQTSYSYNVDGQLTQVTNHYGLSIGFTYTDGKLATVTDALGVVYGYEYDAAENLIAVVLPDTTQGDNTDNPRRIYHYENADYPNYLTGITDENGHRFATWSYDVNGKAISSEHAETTNPVGQEKVELDYQGAN